MESDNEYERLTEDVIEYEQTVHDLSEELSDLEEETEEWYSVLNDLQEAENHLSYLNACMADYVDV